MMAIFLIYKLTQLCKPSKKIIHIGLINLSKFIMKILIDHIWLKTM